MNDAMAGINVFSMNAQSISNSVSQSSMYILSSCVKGSEERFVIYEMRRKKETEGMIGMDVEG